MKVLPLFLVLVVMATSCKKDMPTDCLKAKVIRITCAGTVIQVLSNNNIGEDEWLDIFGNNSRYDNVFAASNSCLIASEHKVGDIVYVTIDKPASNNCIQCALYDAPPKISYEVKTIGNLPCDEGSSK